MCRVYFAVFSWHSELMLAQRDVLEEVRRLFSAEEKNVDAQTYQTSDKYVSKRIYEYVMCNCARSIFIFILNASTNKLFIHLL